MFSFPFEKATFNKDESSSPLLKGSNFSRFTSELTLVQGTTIFLADQNNWIAIPEALTEVHGRQKTVRLTITTYVDILFVNTWDA